MASSSSARRTLRCIDPTFVDPQTGDTLVISLATQRAHAGDGNVFYRVLTNEPIQLGNHNSAAFYQHVLLRPVLVKPPQSAYPPPPRTCARKQSNPTQSNVDVDEVANFSLKFLNPVYLLNKDTDTNDHYGHLAFIQTMVGSSNGLPLQGSCVITPKQVCYSRMYNIFSTLFFSI